MLALFDLDNTLIDRSASLESWARSFAHSRFLPRKAEAVICDRLRERAHPEDFKDETSGRRVSYWIADRDPLAVPSGKSPLLGATRVDFWKPFP